MKCGDHIELLEFCLMEIAEDGLRCRFLHGKVMVGAKPSFSLFGVAARAFIPADVVGGIGRRDQRQHGHYCQGTLYDCRNRIADNHGAEPPAVRMIKNTIRNVRTRLASVRSVQRSKSAVFYR
jgi:hypothetical protein